MGHIEVKQEIQLTTYNNMNISRWKDALSTYLIGWLVLNAKYGSALELCTAPGLGSGEVHCCVTSFTNVLQAKGAVFTADGRHTIVVGGITVVNVLLYKRYIIYNKEMDKLCGIIIFS